MTTEEKTKVVYNAYGLDYEKEEHEKLWWWERWILSSYDETLRYSENTKAYEGYGLPSKGIYNTKMKGFKTFGSVGQGPIPRGVKEYDAKVCQPRNIVLTVYATKDWDNKIFDVEFGAWTFD